ncbi:MAG: HTH domain-containing protein [Bacteroidia bacterium]|nr:HTH domain-containing protein [Bacteroidia bacterium]
MSIISNLDKLKLINSEIKKEQTGSPEDFAKKLCVSRSMLYNYIEEIKTLGAQIKYNRTIKTFYFENNFDITIDIKFQSRNSN